MSDLPSVEEVYKWVPDVVNTFLRSKLKEFLRDQDFKKIEENWISGPALLRLTLGKLLASPYKLPGGPAEVVTELVSKIKGESQGRENAEDSSYFSALNMLKMKPEHIPSRTNLLEYIQQPFIKPIEVHPSNYNIYFKSKLDPSFLNKFFVSSVNASSRLWCEHLIQILCPPEFGSTEESFHSFWDALIFKPLKIACPLGTFNRNSNCHTSTNRFRPDFSYLVNDACLVRGEEKCPSIYDDPAVELISKLTWTYWQMSLHFWDLVTCFPDTLEGRIQAFNIGINIGRLLPLLRQTLPECFEREFTVLHRSSGKTIELLQTSVVKRYKSVEPVEKLKTLYDEMENYNVPFIDHLDQTNMEEKKTSFAVFSPKGVRHKPNSKEQLIKALHCVLTALKFLHEIDIMHRDLRWDNVLRFIDQDKWFIIDFDDACHTRSVTPNIQLARDSHAPEIFQPDHDESVDIWSVGYLIETALSWARISIQRNNNSWIVREIDLELEVLKIIIDNPNKLAGYYPYQPSKDANLVWIPLLPGYTIYTFLKNKYFKLSEFGNDSSFENIRNEGSDYTAFKSMFQQYKFEKNKSFPWVLEFFNKVNIQFLQNIVSQKYPTLFQMYAKTIKAFQKETILNNALKQSKLNSKEQLDEIVTNVIKNAEIRLTILVDTKNYLTLVLSQTCSNCEYNDMKKTYIINAIDFFIKCCLTCKLCGAIIENNNENIDI
ncbi:hypothetical protein C2G38_2221130 [Gigaspora rosea]|uniref:Protein kinase domain-containing protein n=1 Tax=Gigaspora rosea TaxID=44941 RepID=A0A397UC29_9GLOM|nr:hypothetical protein C2G38_2221130 [Gigaspora rosea]